MALKVFHTFSSSPLTAQCFSFVFLYLRYYKINDTAKTSDLFFVFLNLSLSRMKLLNYIHYLSK